MPVRAPRIAVRMVTLLLVTTPVLATTYTLEPDYTEGVFSWSHLGFSYPTAQFAQGAGTLEYDEADPVGASVRVAIPLSTLNTGVPALDEHFRSKDFFEISRFPTATFASTKVAVGEGRNHLRVTGDLNLHGVTKPVTLDVTILKIGMNPRTNSPTVGFYAKTTVKRSEFGLGRFVPQVDDEIQIHITGQGAEQHAYEQHLNAYAQQHPNAKQTKEGTAGRQ
jgi:polyisoprenoid-binding protein YceI